MPFLRLRSRHHRQLRAKHECQRRRSRSDDDDAGVVRCPRCDWPMALRYGRREVVFVCGCGEQPALRRRVA